MPDDNTPGQEPGASPATGGNEPGTNGGQEPQTFDAEYVKGLRAEAAKHRNDAKAARDAAAKAAADLKAAQDAGKSEVEKLAEKVAGLEKTAADAQHRAACLDVVTRKGLPAELADRLRGTTIEELEADADKLAPLVAAGQQQPRPGSFGGGPQGGQPPASFNDQIRAAARR